MARHATRLPGSISMRTPVPLPQPTNVTWGRVCLWNDDPASRGAWTHLKGSGMMSVSLWVVPLYDTSSVMGSDPAPEFAPTSTRPASRQSLYSPPGPSPAA